MKSGAYGGGDAAALLDRAVQALEAARSRLAASVTRAEYWRDEYAGHDWAGLGHSCEQIRAGAEDVYDQATGLAAETGSAAAAVTTVTDTTEPERIIAILTTVQQPLSTVSAGCSAAVESCADLATLIAHNLAGGQPEWLIEQVTTAGTDFDQARRAVDEATGLVKNAIAHAQQAGTARVTVTLVPHSGETVAYVGEPLPSPDERTGAKIIDSIESSGQDTSSSRRVSRFGSRAKKLMDKTFEEADEVGDLLKTGAEDLQRGLPRPPTGHAHTTPQVEVAPPPPQHADFPELVQSVGLVTVMSVKAVSLAVQDFKRRRKGKR